MDSEPHRRSTPGQKWLPEQKKAIQAQLERVVASHQFIGSERCVLFLQHVVESLLKGDIDRLKERIIGSEAFGRDANYDTGADPIVRTAAGEVRKRLAQYYSQPGHGTEVRIDVPTGSYKPEITFPEPESTSEPAHRRRNRWVSAALAAIALTVVLLTRFLVSTPVTPVKRFWAPLVDSGKPIMVVVGQPAPFRFSGPIEEHLQSMVDQSTPGQRLKLEFLPQDVATAKDRYVSIGDAYALAHVVSTVSGLGAKYELRGSYGAGFAEFRGRSTVLIGGFSNQWVMELMKELRFVIKDDAANTRQVILDRTNPEKSDWAIAKVWPRGDVAEDYGLITRVFDRQTESEVIAIGGFTYFSNVAAAELLTRDAYLAQAMSASRDWDRKNLQIVLRVRVLKGATSPPQVLAVHVW